jgi:hypothetical protein
MQSDADRKKGPETAAPGAKAIDQDATAAMKAQRKTVKAIRRCLAKGRRPFPKLPNIAGMPTDKVLWFLATMKKYGQVIEDSKGNRYAMGLDGIIANFEF